MLHICIVSGGSGGRFSSNSSGELDEMGGLLLAAGRDKGVFWPRMAAAIFSPVQSTVALFRVLSCRKYFDSEDMAGGFGKSTTRTIRLTISLLKNTQ